MIFNINTRLDSTGVFPIIHAAGGYDAEFGLASWASTGTLQWAESYSEKATALLYNYGSCENCPRKQSRSTWTEGSVTSELPGTADYDWYLDTLVKASGQIPALERVFRLSYQIPWTVPIPQIYYTVNAYEWYNVRRYAYETPRNKRLQFSGVTSTCPAACSNRYSGAAQDWADIPTTTAYLSAPQSWQSLFDTLNSVTAPDGSATVPTPVPTQEVTPLPTSTPTPLPTNTPTPLSTNTPAPTITNAAVRPVLECVRAEANGQYTAFFGYKNDNTAAVTIAVGPNNRFSPNPQACGQATQFASGRQVSVFTVAFDGTNLVWSLKGPDGQNRTATAASGSTRCK